MTKEKEGRNAILGKFSYFSPCRESSLGEKSGGRIDARKPPSPLPSSSFPFPLSTRLKYHENSFRKLDFFPLTPPPPSSAAALAIAPFNHGLGVPWGESEGDAVEEGRSQICLVASLILSPPLPCATQSELFLKLFPPDPLTLFWWEIPLKRQIVELPLPYLSSQFTILQHYNTGIAVAYARMLLLRFCGVQQYLYQEKDPCREI